MKGTVLELKLIKGVYCIHVTTDIAGIADSLVSGELYLEEIFSISHLASQSNSDSIPSPH